MLPCGWPGIRCCNSARPVALYWRPVHLITLMQAQASFNQPLVRPLTTGPTRLAAAPVFRGALLRLPPQGPAAVQGRRKGLDGGGRGLDGVGVGIGVAGVSSLGHGCSLGDELADQGLHHGTTSSADFLEDALVKSSERVLEFCPKCVMRHVIEFLENGCLVLNNRSPVEICQVFELDQALERGPNLSG